MAVDQGRLSGAATGAKLGSSFGPIGTGVGAVAGAILGGSKGSYAQTTGHHIIGTISKDGFSGEFFGTAANGGEQYKTPLAIGQLSEVARVAFLDTFGKNAPAIPVKFSGSADSQTFWNEVDAGIRMNAPTINSGAGSQGVNASMSAPIMPGSAQPQTLIVPAAAPVGVDSSQIAWGIGLALFTWWLSKQG